FPSVYFIMLPLPPRSTLFPYTTLFRSKLWLSSSTAVDLLYRMRDYVSEEFRGDDLRPSELHIHQHEKQRRDEWSVLFDDRDHLVDRKSTRLNSSHRTISYAVFCLKKKK